MGVHDEHRERMRKRFSENGIENFSEHEVLELLLYHAIPRGDVNPLAHALTEQFGSLANVLDAPLEELKKVKGVGDRAAFLLRLISPLSRRYLISKQRENRRLTSTAAAGEYIAPFFHGETDELFYVFCLDAGCAALSHKALSRGTVNASEISVRKIVEYALSANAVNVIVAHNHPSGSLTPSREDEQTTRVVRDALKVIGVTLLDHIIVANGDFVSLADTGLLS
jgi:DNA repair protein RadC